MPTLPGGFTEYEDFVIVAKRTSARSVSVRVSASPAGRMSKAVPVSFPAREADELSASFHTGSVDAGGRSGRMMITQAEATGIGRRLAHVLFPEAVTRRFAASLAAVFGRQGHGLRIRLAMDDSLLDLPWEYVVRPDRPQQDGVSCFLLLDPSISMVRHAADSAMHVTPISGRQQLAFVGTLWEGQRDGWAVREEFDRLHEALRPVARFIEPEYEVATESRDLDASDTEAAGIFHYAGHVDFDAAGRAFMIRELPTSRGLGPNDIVYIDEVAPTLAARGTRLAVMSACNSGYHAAAGPLLDAGIPAVLGINGAVASQSTIEFCVRLYESLAVGLSLDEAAGRARLHVMEWGATIGLFDWGLYMVHMPSPDATLFPRAETPAVAKKQKSVRQSHAKTIDRTLEMAREIDGMNFGEIMSELSRRRVLILGRFTGRRLEVLEGIKAHLAAHPNRYIPELFTFTRPESRDLVESIIAFAALSRFIIADLSEPKSLPSELEAIVPNFQSVPVVPVINQTGREYATFSSVKRRPNVVKPTVRYRDLDDLLAKLDATVVPAAEQKLDEVRPPGR
jgi:CHAT domain